MSYYALATVQGTQENQNSLCSLEAYSLVGNTGLIKYWALIYNYKLR